MKAFIFIIVLICFITPGWSTLYRKPEIPPPRDSDVELPHEVIQVNTIDKIRGIFKSIPFALWKFNDAVVKIVHKPYKLTNEDMEEMKACHVTVKLRIWHHMKKNSKRVPEIRLTPFEYLCKRIATFKPFDYKSSVSRHTSIDRFDHLTLDYQKWTLPKGYLFIRPTPEEKQEMEDCYFYRTWENKLDSMLSSHEAFCKSLATNKPPTGEEASQMDKKGIIDPLYPFYEEWHNMPQAFMNDYTQICQCFQLESEKIEESSSCEHYYELINSPSTWRDVRRKELHDCKKPSEDQSVIRENECFDLKRSYIRNFYSGKFLEMD